MTYRYKRKFKDANFEISKCRRELDEVRAAEIKALQLKKLESERPVTEDVNDDSQSLGSATGGNGEALGANVLPSHGSVDDTNANQDSSSEGSPNGIIKVRLKK
jgi:hypothetical protein